MAKFKCPNCGYVFWVKPEQRCTCCGYHYDYLEHKDGWTVWSMKQMSDQMIKIRTALCSIMEKDTMKKGLHAWCTVTNQGLILEIFEKFEYGVLVKKKWTFKQNPRYLIPYHEITAIEQGKFQGKPAGFFVYRTKKLGDLALNFSADGCITDKYPQIDREMKELTEEFCRA